MEQELAKSALPSTTSYYVFFLNNDCALLAFWGAADLPSPTTRKAKRVGVAAIRDCGWPLYGLLQNSNQMEHHRPKTDRVISESTFLVNRLMRYLFSLVSALGSLVSVHAKRLYICPRSLEHGKWFAEQTADG